MARSRRKLPMRPASSSQRDCSPPTRTRCGSACPYPLTIASMAAVASALHCRRYVAVEVERDPDRRVTRALLRRSSGECRGRGAGWLPCDASRGTASGASPARFNRGANDVLQELGGSRGPPASSANTSSCSARRRQSVADPRPDAGDADATPRSAVAVSRTFRRERAGLRLGNCQSRAQPLQAAADLERAGVQVHGRAIAARATRLRAILW